MDEMDKVTGRAKSALARKNSLSPEKRSEIARNAALARWESPSDPQTVSEGILPLGNIDLECYVLKDKRRLFSKSAMAKAIGLQSGGGNVFLRTMNSKRLTPLISDKLRHAINNPIHFKTLNGDWAHGYEGAILIEICDVIWEARKTHKLAPNQMLIGVRAELILRSAAKVGIVALIDEATGFLDKTKEEYREYFRECIREDVREWEKEFPDQFFDMIYHLYRIPRKHKNKHPQFFAHFIRKYVYTPLLNSNGAILEMLEEKNPVVYAGGNRRFKLHSFLTENVGIPALQMHLWQLIGIGSATGTKVSFEKGFSKAFPRIGDQASLFEDDDWDLN